jgi:hypothetical protein
MWTTVSPHPKVAHQHSKGNLFNTPSLLILEPLPGAMAAKNKYLAQSNKSDTEDKATKERETGWIGDVPLNDLLK